MSDEKSWWLDPIKNDLPVSQWIVASKELYGYNKFFFFPMKNLDGIFPIKNLDGWIPEKNLRPRVGGL